jgi:hypothetical protein
MTNLMGPAFAMDETFFSSRGSRLDQLRNALELTAITPRAHVRGRTSFDRQSEAKRGGRLSTLPARRTICDSGFLAHLRSLQGYDEPEILRSSTREI